MRRHRAKIGKRLFTAEEIHQLLDGKTVEKSGKKVTLAGASTQLRAMILLGINCGFGNSDVAELSFAEVDLDKGWIDFPRPKTGIDRRCPLWPETITAIKTAIAERPQPKHVEDKECIFITKYHNRWLKGNINSVGLEFGKLQRRLEINGRRGLGFYSLRHSFRTVADGTKDFPAVRLIMGHADGSIDAVYREHIDDERLRAVTAHVRTWLLGDSVKI
jgi:integrase